MKQGLYLLVFAAILSFALPFLHADGDQPDKIIFESSLGPVNFLHGQHQKATNNDCSICHHLKKEAGQQACRTCHKKKNETSSGDPIPFYAVKMQFCRNCHRQKNSETKKGKAPVSCRECHDVTAITWLK